uniref:L1 transposable element RRM domain-containing protein n=1 Tax=Sander lucioperca TaxID=283035 RepID=A0A8C9XRJ6_SANLU
DRDRQRQRETNRQTERQRQGETETDRQRQTERDRDREKQTDRQRDRDRQTETETGRNRNRQTETETERNKDRQRQTDGSETGRIMEAETRISTAEDEIQTLKETIGKLESKTKNLTNKVEDLEGRSRRNNLRVLGLPEKVEGNDTCSFMEKWIADTLKITPPVLERAHRVKESQSSTTYPRTIIIKCLNFKDRENILKAARIQKEVLYQNNKQRSYDGVRKRLRELGLDKHQVIYPARLLLTNDERTVVFNTPADVSKYIKKLEPVIEDD